MKKAIAFLLVICFIMAVTAGCVGGDSNSDPSGAPVSQPTATGANTNTNSNSNNAQTQSPVPTIAPVAAKTPSDSYTRYSELKSLAYERISGAIEENIEENWELSFALLPLAMVDLSLIPMLLIGVEGGDETLGMMSMLGIMDAKVDQNGNSYTLTYKNPDGESLVMTCEYDAATDSVRSKMTQTESEELFFEYVSTGSGYASQYYYPEEDGSYSLITAYFDDSDLAGFGMTTVSKEPESIFKKTGLKSDFIKNDDMYFYIEGGVLTIFQDGETQTY